MWTLRHRRGAPILLPVLVSLALLAPALALAQDVDEAEMTLTECVLSGAMRDHQSAVVAFDEGTFRPYIVAMIGRCSEQAGALIDIVDRIGGKGAGIQLLNGSYARRLPDLILRRYRILLQSSLVSDLDPARRRAALGDAALADLKARMERQRR